MSHITDWKPGHISNDYRDNYDRIFSNKEEEEEHTERKQSKVCLECPRNVGPGCICDFTEPVHS
jgi:hypothetical protein